MVCQTCAHWVAKTWKMYHHRQGMLTKFPDVTPYYCPQCGNNDWATAQPLSIDKRNRIESHIVIAVIASLAISVLVIALTLVGHIVAG